MSEIQSRCGILCESCEFVQSMGCKGCVNVKNPFHGECSVKNCCEGRENVHCGECEEFPCEALKQMAFDTQYGDGDDRRLRVCAKWAGIDYPKNLRCKGEYVMIQSRCGILCEECKYRESMGCKGCTNIENPFWGECPVKASCESKGHEHCGQCAEFPCRLANDMAYDKEQGDDGKRLEQCRKWAGL